MCQEYTWKQILGSLVWTNGAYREYRKFFLPIMMDSFIILYLSFLSDTHKHTNQKHRQQMISQLNDPVHSEQLRLISSSKYVDNQDLSKAMAYRSVNNGRLCIIGKLEVKCDLQRQRYSLGYSHVHQVMNQPTGVNLKKKHTKQINFKLYIP